MARHKAFNTVDVIEEAMQVFWTQGYEATSLSDLTWAMGLSKSSFYETFGSKHDLFLVAIEHYKNTVTAKITDAVEINAPARRVIESLFDRALERILSDDGRRGCFLNNTAAAVAIHDAAAQSGVREGLGVMEDAIHQLVIRGQREMQINPAHDPRRLARFIISSLNGMLVIGKANPDREVLGDIAKVSLASLD